MSLSAPACGSVILSGRRSSGMDTCKALLHLNGQTILQGRLHPLCGIYRKAALPALESRLEGGRCKMPHLLNDLSVSLPDTAVRLSDKVFFNTNTPRDFFLAATNE